MLATAMTTAAAAPGRSTTFNDAVSTSSSTLVNPDIEEETRRKLSSRAPAYGKALGNHSAAAMGSMLEARPSSAPRATFARRRVEYADDHRCSDQEYTSGLCGCTQDGSAESSSSTSLADDYSASRRRLSRRSSDQDFVPSEETYDMRMIAARRKKLLSEKNMRSQPKPPSPERTRVKYETPLDASKQDKNPPSASCSRDLQSDPVLVQRERRQRGIAELQHGNESSESDTGRRDDIRMDRAWASSPIPQAHHNSADYDQFAQSNQNDSLRMEGQSVSPKGKRPSPQSAPRKSIDAVYQKLLQEQQQKQEDIRQKKEAARNRRRQELKIRQDSQWPSASMSMYGQEAESSDHDGMVVEDKGQGVKNGTVLQASPNREQAGGSSGSAAKEEALTADTCRDNRTSSSPIAPRPSPVKPSAEAYKARLLALRSSYTSSPNNSREAITPRAEPPSLDRPHASSFAEGIDESRDENVDQVTLGSDFTGHGPLQSTPPRSGNTSANLSRSKELSPPRTATIPTPSESDDTIRATLRKLTVALQEVNEMKVDPDLKAKLSTALSQGLQGDQQPLVSQQADLSVDMKRADENTLEDKIYVEKLDGVRKRIKVLSDNAPLQTTLLPAASPRRNWNRLVLSLLVQLSALILMMMMAERRAHQLFITTYYDPFQPSGLFTLPAATIGSYVQPFLYDSGEYHAADSQTVVNGSVYRGPQIDKQGMWKSLLESTSNLYRQFSFHQDLLKKAVAMLGIDADAVNYACNFSPT